ncbi:MAG: hypothetical protein RIR26_374 [Pseudomonadota bacterium]
MNSFTLLPALMTLIASPQPASMCGQDDRFLTQESAVGYVTARPATSNQRSPVCTITLISDSCALTAGHCLEALESAVFQAADATGHSAPLNTRTYAVDKNSVAALQTRIGNDWAVVRLKENEVTGLRPGKVHGFLEPELDPAFPPEASLEVTTAEKDEQSTGFVQWKSDGSTLWTEGSILYHDLDTGKGSSGSLVLNRSNGKAVAIHTHGGCETMKNNKATIIARVPNLVRSIRACRMGLRQW